MLLPRKLQPVMDDLAVYGGFLIRHRKISNQLRSSSCAEKLQDSETLCCAAFRVTQIKWCGSMFVLLSKNSFIFSFFRLLSTVRAGNAG